MLRLRPPRALLILSLVAGGLCLSSCLFGGNDELEEPKTDILPGLYRGDYGPDFSGFESELTLGFDGGYRWFAVNGNYAVAAFRGQWSERQGFALFHDHQSNDTYGSETLTDFRSTPPDSAPIRSTTSHGFEKYEISPYGGRGVWVSYRRAFFARLSPGKYVLRDTTFVYVLDTLGSWNLEPVAERREFQLRTGSISGYRRYFNDTPEREIEIPNWIQAGSFLVSERPRRRFYVDSLMDFGDWADTLNGEWVFRIQNASDSGFQYWDGQYDDWLEFRREP